MKNTMQMQKNQLIESLRFAPSWEIRDANFDHTLASSENGKSFEDVLNELQETCTGHNLKIKAGKKDTNGKFSALTKTFSFTMPETNANEDYEIQIVQNQNAQSNLFGFLPKNQNTMPAGVYDLVLDTKIKALEGLFSTQVEKIQAESTKTLGEIENKYRAQLLDMRETAIAEKEQYLREKEQQLEDEEQEKLEKILPTGRTILNGIGKLFSELIDKKSPLSGLSEKTDKQKEEESEDEDEEFDEDEIKEVSHEENEQIDVILGKLTAEQKNALLEKLSNELEDEIIKETETQNAE